MGLGAVSRVFRRSFCSARHVRPAEGRDPAERCLCRSEPSGLWPLLLRSWEQRKGHSKALMPVPASFFLTLSPHTGTSSQSSFLRQRRPRLREVKGLVHDKGVSDSARRVPLAA